MFVLLEERLRLAHCEFVQSLYDSCFSTHFKDIVHRIAIYNEISEASDKYMRQYYSTTYLAGCFLTVLNDSNPGDNHIDPNKKIQQIVPDYRSQIKSKVSGALQPERRFVEDRMSKKADLRWENDGRNPATDILLLEGYVRYLMIPGFEVFFYENGCFVNSLADGSYFASSVEGGFLNQFSRSEEGGPFEMDQKLVNLKFPVKSLRKVRKETGEILFEVDVEQILELATRCLKINGINIGLYQQSILGRHELIEKKTKQIEECKDPFQVVQCCASDSAICEAFYNRSVKLKFSDRTVITLDPNSDHFNILTKLGESLTVLVRNPGPHMEYFEEALAYWEHVFGDPVEREERLKKQEQMQAAINHQLYRSEQILNIIRGKPVEGLDDYEEIKKRILVEKETMPVHPKSEKMSIVGREEDRGPKWGEEEDRVRTVKKK